MKNRRMVITLLVLIAIAAGSLIYWLTAPRLLKISPASGADNVPAASPLRLTFSLAMQPASVTERLSTDPPMKGKFTWEGNTLLFMPDLPWPSGETITVHLAAGGRSAGLLGLTLRQERQWTFTIGDSLLAYLYPSDGPSDIYSLDPQTGDEERLTNSSGEVLDFSVSTTGADIYYTTSQGEDGSTIYRLDRLTGNIEVILKCPQALCRYPVVSPGGDFLAYERTSLSSNSQPNNPQVWLLPLVKGGLPSSGPVSAPMLVADPAHQTQQPFWSPAGMLTYYDMTLSAFIIKDPANGKTLQFSNQTGLLGTWGPTGKTLVTSEIFANTINDPNTLGDLSPLPYAHLMRFNTADGSVQDLSGTDYLEDTSPSFSPDGTLLAFARRYLDVARWTPGRQLWLMRPDGGNAHALSQDPQYNYYNFTWSQDGSHLAYVRFNQAALTEPPEIWWVDVNGTHAVQLVTGGYAPQWIP
jgi:Tol biopolymer transport system component